VRHASVSVACQGSYDDVESVLVAASGLGRMRERRDYLEFLDDVARPTVRDDQRQSVRVTRVDVYEVNVDAVDRRHELWQGVELRFGLAPVVLGPPVLHERLQLFELHTLGEVLDSFAIGPARGSDARAQVIERGLGLL